MTATVPSAHRRHRRALIHRDGTVVIIRAYHADGSLHIMSDRAEIELTDNGNDPYSPDPISLVRLP